MIAGFKTKYDNGQPTFFLEKIIRGFQLNDIKLTDVQKEIRMRSDYKDVIPKIHTIRGGKRWKPGMTIHMSTGVRTKKYNCFAEVKCTAVQDIEIFFNSDGLMRGLIIDDRCLTLGQSDTLAKNDGLTMLEFVNWFGSQTVHDTNYGFEIFSGQIIHWTDAIRY